MSFSARPLPRRSFLRHPLLWAVLLGGAVAVFSPARSASAGSLFGYWGGGDCSGIFGHAASPWRFPGFDWRHHHHKVSFPGFPWRHHGFDWRHHRHEAGFPRGHPRLPGWPNSSSSHWGDSQRWQESASQHELGDSGHGQWRDIGFSHRYHRFGVM